MESMNNAPSQPFASKKWSILPFLIDIGIGLVFFLLIRWVGWDQFSLNLTLAGLGGLMAGVFMRQYYPSTAFLRITILSMPIWIYTLWKFSFPQQALIPLLFMYMADYSIKKEVSLFPLSAFSSFRSILITAAIIPTIIHFILPTFAVNWMGKEEHIPAPPLSWETIEGESLDPAELQGKVVIIDFWGTWCGPCIAAFPQWEAIYDSYKSHPKVTMVMLNTLSHGDHPARIKTFLTQRNSSLPIGLDVEGLADQVKVRSLPNTIIIDPKGMIRYRHTGFLPGEDLKAQISDQVERILAEEDESE